MLLLIGPLLGGGGGTAARAVAVGTLLLGGGGSVALFALVLLVVLVLGVPLAGLEDEDADEDEGEDGVAGGHDLEAVLAAEDHGAVGSGGGGGGRGQVAGEVGGVPDAGADEAQALDDVGDVDADADDVEHERRAVEQHVALGGLEQLDEEAAEAGADHDAQHARDEGRRLVHELEVRLQLVEVRGRDGVRGPEEREVIGELGEEDAEEEAHGCAEDMGYMVSLALGLRPAASRVGGRRGADRNAGSPAGETGCGTRDATRRRGGFWLLTPDDHEGRKGRGAAVVLGPHVLGPIYPFVRHGDGRWCVVVCSWKDAKRARLQGRGRESLLCLATKAWSICCLDESDRNGCCRWKHPRLDR